MKRHKWGSFNGPYGIGSDFYSDFWWAQWRNWPCGACGLWKRAKVHR